MSSKTPFPVRLFYSYSHKDEKFRSDMEKSLALLRRKKILQEWSDHKILPGQPINAAVKKEIENSDIVVFLLSQNFISSDACMQEWEDCKNISSSDKPRIRIPIILSECPWKDMLEPEDIKVLPKDGNEVMSYPDQATAWNEVYEGIKSVIESIQNNFSPKKKLLQEIEETEFVSQDHINLRDIFVFPALTCINSQSGSENILIEDQIINEEQLLSRKYVLLRGDEMSGKTTLAKHLLRTLIERNHPVIFIDLNEVHGIGSEQTFQSVYRDQFNGDFNIWFKQEEKTIILDNLSSTPNSIKFVESAKEHFENIIVSVSSDTYQSFYWDDERLADFDKINIEPLSHVSQERLIRRRLELMHPEYSITDGTVDEIERRVNSIINKQILPRYPFYVLSVIQTFEGFMPSNLSITTYGHCYYVLILSRLIKAGISNRDEDINSCLNFSEHLAYQIYDHETLQDRTFTREDFVRFVDKYRNSYIMTDAILNRLKQFQYGILSEDGRFRIPYMHYFFLGMYLAKPANNKKEITEDICKYSHYRKNHLILLFIIHHAIDNEIIDSILLWSMCTIDSIEPANLGPDETKRFRNIISSLPKDLLTGNDESIEREKERKIRDVGENHKFDDREESKNEDGDMEGMNDCYRILKNNELLGQILRSNYGRLKKDRIAEIIATISDGGLRLVNSALSDENEISTLALYVKKSYPEKNIDQLKDTLRFLSFLWTMKNVEAIVASIRHREIKEIVTKVAKNKGTPAYDIIQYFSALDNATELTNGLNKRLSKLIRKHNDPFIFGVLSIRTQHYINTHRSKAVVEQKTCSLLGIPYKHKARRLVDSGM